MQATEKRIYVLGTDFPMYANYFVLAAREQPQEFPTNGHISGFETYSTQWL